MKMINYILTVLCIVMLAGKSYAQEELKAKAVLYNPEGTIAGVVYFEEKDDIVKITVNITNLPAGKRALHIHEYGECDEPDFESAGGHFNPYQTEHGFLNPEGPHAGDLPNFEVGNNGMTTFTVLTKRVTLKPMRLIPFLRMKEDQSLSTSSRTIISQIPQVRRARALHAESLLK